jgi:hypothetical protein
LLVLAALSPVPALAADGAGPHPAAESGFERRTLPGGAVLRIAPGTRYSLGSPIKVQLGSSPERKLAQSITLQSGRIDVELPKAKYPRTGVFIQTPHKVSVVAKGGHSVVIVADARATVAALDAELLVGSGTSWGVLAAGLIREYEHGQARAEHGPLPPPKAGLSTPIALSLGGARVTVTANASPVPGATEYEFSLRRAGGDRALVSRARSRDGRVTFGGLEAGTYEVSARALEASGLEGQESEALVLRVVGAEPPEGGKVIDGGLRLLANQRVELRGTDGVELSYGAGALFMPAPSTIGLYRGETTVVRLRSRGFDKELSFLLAPRVLRAEIQMGPARARWPHDKVIVNIRLRDGQGKPIQEQVAIDAKVSVNLAPVEIEWKREGDVLRGVVPRSTEPGPWAVRVEVYDEIGTLLANDLLEVIESERGAKR